MNAFLIARRDLSAYLRGYTGWIVAAVLLAFVGAIFQIFILDGAKFSHEVLEDFFYYMAGTATVATILLSMGSLSDERQQGTDVLLATSTASPGQVVLGKWLAAMGLMGGIVALTAYLPALIFVNGKVSLAHVAIGYLGSLLVCGFAAAVGIFWSSLARHQLLAGVLAGVTVAAFVFSFILANFSDAPLTGIFEYAAYWDKHFHHSFRQGRLHSRDLVYYGSLIFVFLLGATKVVEGRRWQ